MATNVYYSACPFGTGNLLSGGSPTIVIDASGNATLTLGGATQVDNIGQGVCVEYNSVVSYIDSITDATHFHLVSALGASRGAQASTAVSSIHHAYASLAAAEAGASDANHINNADLTAADVVLNICCYYDHDDQTADTTAVAINGYTTDATRRINIYTPAGGTQSVKSQRHSGKWSSQKYVLNSASDGNGIVVNDDYVRLDGLQITLIGSAKYRSGIDGNNIGFTVFNCIVRNQSTGTYLFGISLYDTTSGRTGVFNSIVYGFNTTASSGITVVGSSGVYAVDVYNTTVCGCTYGISGTTGVIRVRNCAVFNNSDDFTSNGYESVTYTASDDNDISGTGNVDISPGATEADDWAAAFTDYANGDFSIKNTSSVLYNAGTTISGMTAVDIIGTSRPQSTSWDIGAFEYVVASETYSGRGIGRGISRGIMR